MKIAEIAGSAGKKAADAIGKTKDKAVQLVDQNADGKFDFTDISEMASSVGSVAKRTASTLKEVSDERKKASKRNDLDPIFAEDLESADFLLPKLIFVGERDEKHRDNEICEGSIGHWVRNKNMNMVVIYPENLDLFGIELVYNDVEEGAYYVDPCDRDKYVFIESYFEYLKQVRLTELQRIADKLGATHFRVTVNEKKMNAAVQKIKGQGKAMVNAKGDFDYTVDRKTVESSKVAMEMTFSGHMPEEPQLCYLKNDVSIKNLIDMRMSEKSSLQNQRLEIYLENSSGIKFNDAIKIDAALKGVKINSNFSMESETKREFQKALEYYIEF